MMNIAALVLAATLTPAQIDSVISAAEKARFYAFPQTAARAVVMLKANTPRYVKLSDSNALKEAVDKDLYAVTHDKHIHLLYPFEGSDENVLPSAAELRAAYFRTGRTTSDSNRCAGFPETSGTSTSATSQTIPESARPSLRRWDS